MTQHAEPTPSQSPAEPRITLRTPADLAEALPYLLGFHPDDSVVMVALHGVRGRFGERLRVGIPTETDEWADVAAQLADCLVNGVGQAARPEGIVVFLCQDPRATESPAQAMERLRPLAQMLRTACGTLDVPVLEALCVSAGRWWSYCCPGVDCCPPEGVALARDATSVMAAAAAYAGLRAPGSLREMQARYAPLSGPWAQPQERALDEACAELVPRLLRAGDCEAVCEETLALAGAALERFRAMPPIPEGPQGDARDDTLLSEVEAAAIILGLQDRATRDRAAEWMEEPEAIPVLRLWRALARRCVGAYVDHAAAPLTLAGWVCWATGDEPAARIAFGRALDVDPDYTFAKLLNQACNQGIDPEPLRRSLRAEQRRHRERADRRGAGTAPRGRRVDGRPTERAGAGRRSSHRAGRSPVVGEAGTSRPPGTACPDGAAPDAAQEDSAQG
jgi:hypothetical protein